MCIRDRDKATNKEQQIRIQASGGLSDKEIEKMVKEAEANATEDKKRKEVVEAKNHAESLMHSTQKSVVELGDKITPADKEAVEAAVADLKSALEGEDAEVIKEKTNVLAQAAMKLGEALYKQSGGGASTDGEVPNMEKDDAEDDIVDADFTEVGDDDKKTS